jgi:hypothetical protein
MVVATHKLVLPEELRCRFSPSASAIMFNKLTF